MNTIRDEDVEIEWEPAQPDPLGKRLAHGFMDPIYGAGQLAEKAVAATGLPAAIGRMRGHEQPTGMGAMDEVIRQREAAYNPPAGVDWGRMGGNVASPVTWLGPSKGAGMLTKTLAARGATGGAVQGALAPTTAIDNYWNEKLAGTALGAGVGSFGGLAGDLMGKPKTAAVQALESAGVPLTPGMSGGLLAKQAERAAGALPLAAGRLAARSTDTVHGYGTAAVNAVVPSPVKADNVRDAIRAGHTQVKSMYEGLVQDPRAMATTRPQAFGEVVKWSQQQPTNPAVLKRMGELMGTLKDDTITPAMLKSIDSDIGDWARRYSKSLDPLQQEIGDQFYALQQAWRGNVLHPALSNVPGAAETLPAANEAYKGLLQIRKAVGNRDNLSPTALRNTLEGTSLGGLSRQATSLSELNNAARGIVPERLPSDDAGASLGGAIGIGSAAGLGWLLGDPMVAAVVGGGIAPAAAGLGTRAGMKAAKGVQTAGRAMAPQTPAFSRALTAALRGQLPPAAMPVISDEDVIIEE